MAGRGGAGVGAVVTISIMGLLVLGLFVSTLVFYTQNNKTQTALNEANQALRDYVREEERQNDRVRAYLAEAQDGRSSLVSYLIDALEGANRVAIGLPRVKPADLRERVGRIEGVQSSNLMAALQERDQQIASLTSALASANAARQQAQLDLTNARTSVSRIESDFTSAMNNVNQRVVSYGNDIRTYLDSLRNVENLTRQQMIDLANDYTANLAKVNADLAREREQNLILRENLRQREGQRQATGLIPDVAALVDAQVVATSPADREVTINRGRRDKITLGMTFTVYSSDTQIRVDPSTGNYLQGKATLEVIRIADATATCRIITERQGNPVVRGDVLCNALYDPSKTFRLVVYGNFDANRDGISTPRERDDLVDDIRAWGGLVVDELAGDVDFLVLGSRPVVPPPPPPGADIAVLSEWQRLDQAARRYDDLFNRARDSSIPILNQNRLWFLIGR